ncbi:MAG: nucleotidyltransferase substrate binding protein [Planctomycetaceae bacterium]|jgi:nucleotidyltransferase substrate binding protein (TIGR01987 family)|nr:nucleotidyltransferase substrate binding protein [Planctomycetaceae bacterium]
MHIDPRVGLDEMSCDQSLPFIEFLRERLQKIKVPIKRKIMEIEKEIRWRQRFQNFSRAIVLLMEIEENTLDTLKPIEQEGFIQRFEYTLELAWKTVKDYLTEQGHVITEASPKPIIKKAFEVGVITDGQVFIDMIEARNLLAHTYDFDRFSAILVKVQKEFLPALKTLYAFLAEK